LVKEGFLDLTGILHLHERKIIGWGLINRMTLKETS
jgi:hypothetical protein